VSDRVSGFEDWIPTLLELIGAQKAIPANVDGISMAPTLLGKSQPVRPFLYREFPAYGGQQMVRMGDWKGLRMNLLPAANTKKKGKTAAGPTFELYNLKTDPAETTNVAAQHPDIVAKIQQIMREQHVNSADFPFAALDR
jgi:arylsulfatase A-like enzyme